MNHLGRVALKLFGNYYRRRRPALPLLANDLIAARFYISLEQWLSRVTLYSLALAFFCLILAVIAAALFLDHVFIWSTLSKYPLSEVDFLWLMAEMGIVLAIILVGFTLPFAAFALYPWVRAWERKLKIDGHLPYAIGWMSTMVSVGVAPYMTFKKLAEAEEYFGEVSNEASLVVRDVEVLGFDFISALRNLVATAPSTHLRTFVQGAITNALSGGEMGDYFISKARETTEEKRRKFGDFIETLGLISELYITGIIATPLFIIVLYSAMMMMRGSSPVVLMVIIYLFIPLGSFFLLLITDALAPEGRK